MVLTLICGAPLCLFLGCGEEDPCGQPQTLVCAESAVRQQDGCGELQGVLFTCPCGCNAAATDCASCDCPAGEVWDGASRACESVLSCGSGTTLDPGSGQCLPDFSCGEGTHPDDTGRCVPDLLPAADLLEEAVENDVRYEGTPLTIQLPETAGETLTLGGNISAPQDRDEDGLVDGDWDGFQFTAEAGTYLRIKGVSGGAALPAFVVWLLDDEGAKLFTRYGVNPVGPVAEREVYLPLDGSYILQVTDYRNMWDEITYGDNREVIPVGGQGFSYQLQIQRLGDPVVEERSELPLTESGELTHNELRFFRVRGLKRGDLFRVGAEYAYWSLPERLLPAVLVFDPEGKLLSTKQHLSRFAATHDGDFLVVQDFLRLTSADRSFLLTVTREPFTDCDVEQCTGPQSPGISPVAPLRFSVGKSALSVFTMHHRESISTGWYLWGALYDINLRQVARERAYRDSSDKLLYPAALYHLSTAESFVYLEITGTKFIEGFDLYTGSVPSVEIQEGAVHQGVVGDLPPEILSDSALDHFTAAGGQVALFSAPVTGAPGGQSWIDPQQSIYTLEGFEPIGPALNATTLEPLEPRLAYVPQDGTCIHRVWDESASAQIVGGTYDTTLQLQDTTTLGAPAEAQPVEHLGGQLDADTGMAFFTFEASEDTAYEVSLSPSAVALIQPEIWLLQTGVSASDEVEQQEAPGTLFWYPDAQSRTLGRVRGAMGGAPGEQVKMKYWSAQPGLALIAVQDGGAAAAGADTFDIQVTQVQPPVHTLPDSPEPLDLSAGWLSFSGSTYGATRAVDLGNYINSSCTHSLTSGPDLFFSLNLQEGQTLALTLWPQADWDGAVYLFTDPLQPKYSCVAGSGEAFLGGSEHITYTVGAGEGPLFLLGVDGRRAHDAGEFQLAISVTP